MKNRKPKDVRKHTGIIFAVGLLVGLYGLAGNEVREGALITGVAILMAGVLHHFIFYHCPYCGRFLDRSSGEYCPYCGKEVNKE